MSSEQLGGRKLDRRNQTQILTSSSTDLVAR